MSLIKNMSIRKKLLLGFLVVAFITLIVGSVGTVGIFTLGKHESTLYKEGVESLTGVNGMYAVIAEQRLELRGIVINIDEPKAFNENIEKLRTREEEFDELYGLYFAATSGTDEKENELINKAMDIYNGPLKDIKEQMIKALQSGDKAAALMAFEQSATVAEQATEALYEMVLYGGERAAEISENDSRTAYMLMGISVVLTLLSVALAIILGLYIAKIVANPVSNMANAARALSVGNVEVNLSVDSNDEIGDLAKSFKKMIAGIREQAVLLGAVAQGDYTVAVPVRSDKDVMNRAIQDLVKNSGDMLMNIQTASNQVTAASEQISQAAQGLASGSSEQAASIEEFSATLAELEKKTTHNAESSTKAREANKEAGSQLKDSIRSMDELLASMKAIEESSSSITKVIKVIDDIAFQTNILALNAAVEAARAGQHGKGFAVVADEVRNLASKSAAAAKETAALIEGSSERVAEGNQIVAKTNASLQTVCEYAQELDQLVDSVAVATTEQARSIAEINQGIDQISTVVQANSATAEESAAAAQEMLAQATVLNEIVAAFKLKSSNAQGRKPDSSGESADPRGFKPVEIPDAAGFALPQRKLFRLCKES